MNFSKIRNRFATKPRKTVFLLKFKRTYNSQHHKQKKRPENQSVNSKFVDPQGLKLNNTTPSYTTILLIFNALQKLKQQYISRKHSERNLI